MYKTENYYTESNNQDPERYMPLGLSTMQMLSRELKTSFCNLQELQKSDKWKKNIEGVSRKNYREENSRMQVQ